MSVVLTPGGARSELEGVALYPQWRFSDQGPRRSGGVLCCTQTGHADARCCRLPSFPWGAGQWSPPKPGGGVSGKGSLDRTINHLL